MPRRAEPDLIEACESARIWEMISSLPDGLDPVVGDRGHRLSGGEKQRIALARLLLKSPPIVVLGEGTAHLDSESGEAIRRALKTALSGRTSLVIAHRLSTLLEADQIIVLEKGRIRERGTHGDLLAADRLYAELFRTQFDVQMAKGPRARPVKPPSGAVRAALGTLCLPACGRRSPPDRPADQRDPARMADGGTVTAGSAGHSQRHRRDPARRPDPALRRPARPIVLHADQRFHVPARN